MTQDEIFEIAKQAGFMRHLGVICIPNFQSLERFVELIAADEREACAKWLEDEVDAPNWAEQIRARGQA
jgi:hypothetical protein